MRRKLIVLAWACAWLAVACHSGEPFEIASDSPAAAGVAQLSLQARFGCALLESGGVKCWGRSEHGALGQAGISRVDDPSKVPPLDFGTSRRVVQVAVGWSHACVLFDDQRARCWGKNDRGQLGRGDVENFGDDAGETLDTLDDLPLMNVQALSLGLVNTCALVRALGQDGSVHCWGSDTGGALGDAASGDFGDNEPIDALRPAALPGAALAVATGAELACALLEAGPVHCWGDNWAHTLGIGATTCDIGAGQPCFGDRGRVPDIPVNRLPPEGLALLRVRSNSACAVDTSGQLYCWGRNSESRLGSPDASGEYLDEAEPIELGPGVRVRDVALGVRHGCALDQSGAVRCWGEAGPALGYGMPSDPGVAGIGGFETPAQAYAARSDEGVVELNTFNGGERVMTLEAGFGVSCALMDNGQVRCWGDNEDGLLGYGAGVDEIGASESPARALERLGLHGISF